MNGSRIRLIISVNRCESVSDMMLFEKTKPIYSFCVQSAAYCVNGFEKTKPICGRAKLAQSLM